MDYPVARLYSRTRHTNGRDITHEEEGSDHEFGRVEEEGERERDGRVGEGRGEKEENEDETVEDWRSWVVLFGCFMLVGEQISSSKSNSSEAYLIHPLGLYSLLSGTTYGKHRDPFQSPSQFQSPAHRQHQPYVKCSFLIRYRY